jgi:hypothetical protein
MCVKRKQGHRIRVKILVQLVFFFLRYGAVNVDNGISGDLGYIYLVNKLIIEDFIGSALYIFIYNICMNCEI